MSAATFHTETPDDLKRAAARLDDFGTALADAASDLRATGVAWSSIARTFGVAVNSAKERFGCWPRPFEAERLRRRLASYGVTRARVSSFDRFVVADVGTEAHPWRIVRRTATADEATKLAAYLGTTDVARYVKRPGDLDPATVLPWHFGPAVDA